MSFLTSMFKTEKPVIGMLHLRPLPGDPLYYPGGSVSQVVEAAKRDLEALQQGGVDGILITNELSMPYEQHVSPSTLASMGYVIGALSHDLSTPWGAEAIYDGDATIELCAAVDAQFTRCNFCGAWAGDLGLINRDFAHTMRRKAALRLDDLKLFHFITSEGEVYLNDRTTADIADSLLFNCLPDAMVIGGSAAGRGASGELADEVRERVGQVPVVCGTGCRENTVADVFAHYDGAFVGTCLKRDGKLDAPVDVERVARFMAAACRASWWRDRGLTRHRSDAWAFPHWVAIVCRSIPSATRWRPRFCMESTHVRSRRLTSFFPNMGQIAHASFSGTIPVRQILLLRSCGLRRICPRCTNVPRSS